MTSNKQKHTIVPQHKGYGAASIRLLKDVAKHCGTNRNQELIKQLIPRKYNK